MENEKTTFLEAIAKFTHIGEVYYKSHYYDNVMNIFYELTEEERKELLRAIYQISMLVQNGVIENPLRQDPRESFVRERPEQGKATATTTFVITMLVFMIFILLAIFFILGLDSDNGASFRTLFKLLGFMFS